MTPEERQGLRNLVADAQRQKYLADMAEKKTCKGCGGPQEETVWTCTQCRERYKTRVRRELAQATAQNLHQAELLDAYARKNTELREKLARTENHLQQARLEARTLRLAVSPSSVRYDTEEERKEARRRTYRESARRRYHAKKTERNAA